MVTDAANRPKIMFEGGRPVPVICVGATDSQNVSGDLDFDTVIEGGLPFDGVARPTDDSFVLLYTSGTTGQPKGVEVPVEALAPFHSYMRHGLDVRPDDVAWNVADPGWAYGLYYGIVGTLMLGRRSSGGRLRSIRWTSFQPFSGTGSPTLLGPRPCTGRCGRPVCRPGFATRIGCVRSQAAENL